MAKISVSAYPLVSVIIPTLSESRKNNVELLVKDLKLQTFKEIEIIIIKGISPHGRAINMGCAQASGEYLLILDDDSRIPNTDVVNILVRTLKENRDIGMAGASIIIPPYANRFQKKAIAQFPRYNMEVVNRITESDMACHGCCLIPKKVFVDAGGEGEDIIRGLDPDLRHRLRKAGKKIVLAPNCWVYHPLPATLGKFLKLFFRNGMGSAYCLKYKPEAIVETDESLELKKFKEKRCLFYRVIRFPLRLLAALFSLRLLRFIAYISYGLGLLYGLLKFSFYKNEKL